MPRRFLLATGLTLALGAASGGLSCSSGSPATPLDAAPVDVTILGGFDAPPAFDAGGDASPLRTNLRVALVSPLRLGIDICVRPGIVNAAYEGPLLYDLPTLPDAGEDAKKKHPVEASTATDAAIDAGASHDAGSIGDGSHPSDATSDAPSPSASSVPSW